MVKTSNVHKLAFFSFYENGAFLKVLKSYLPRSASAVPVQKCDLIIHFRYIICERVTGKINLKVRFLTNSNFHSNFTRNYWYVFANFYSSLNHRLSILVQTREKIKLFF